MHFQVCRIFVELVEFLQKKRRFLRKRGEYIFNVLMLSEYSQNTRHTLPNASERSYGVATSSRLLKIIGLFCKRAL